MWFKRSKTDNSKFPSFWSDYLYQNQQPREGSERIEQLRFIVLDTETTGPVLKEDQAISIGCVPVQQNEILVPESIEFLINPHQHIKGESIEIHGITPQNLQGAGGIEEAMVNFVQYVKNDILVGHHVSHDVAILNKAIAQLVDDQLVNPTLCTRDLALRVERFNQSSETYKPEEYSLDALCVRYQITPDDRHTAAGDAFIAAQLLIKLLREAKGRGITSFRQLIKKKRWGFW